jgi:hypothetical protein
VQGIQEDFKQNDGKNPNHTSSPSDAQKKYCAKLGEVFMQSQRRKNNNKKMVL